MEHERYGSIVINDQHSKPMLGAAEAMVQCAEELFLFSDTSMDAFFGEIIKQLNRGSVNIAGLGDGPR
eukprot:4432374-Amphidinium_carterae.1